jgi:hypothetical protein
VLKTRVGRWILALVLLSAAGMYFTHGFEGFGSLGSQFAPQQNERSHNIPHMREHDGGVLRTTVMWEGVKPDLVLMGVESWPERFRGPQIPDRPSRIQRTYTYNPRLQYIAAAEQDDVTFKGPLDCEITLDGIHVDGDRLAHGSGGVDCYMLPA